MNQIPNFLLERVRLSPNRIAVATDTEEITFKELHERVLDFAGRLHNQGIESGNHVSVLMKNSIDFIVTVFALHYIGAIAILLNTKLSQDEIIYQLENSDTNFLVIDVHNPFTKIPERINLLKINEIHSYESKTINIKETFEIDEVATMMFTSGTTGFPKAVLQTYSNHLNSAISSLLNLGLNQNDVWLVCLPMFHVGGLSTVYKSAIYGMKIVLLDKADANAILDCINKHKVTIISVVTKVLNDLLSIKHKPGLNKIRAALLGGGPAPLPLLQKAQIKNVPVYQTYGMTETCSQIATLSPEYMLSKIGSAGKALFGCALEIRHSGERCLSGVVGEIVVKGPNVSKGYYKMSQSNESSDFFYTGDLGYLDEDGFLYVVDRRSDLIISGGENIYPAEIESILLSHPDIIEAGVVGKEDNTWGKVPIAFIVANSLNQPSNEEVIEFCKGKLAGYKIPKEVYYVKQLPRNATNKLVRRELLKLL